MSWYVDWLRMVLKDVSARSLFAGVYMSGCRNKGCFQL